MKEQLCQKRIELTKHIGTIPWTWGELERVLKSLKNGKCRDPKGLINELFKSDVAAEDLLFPYLK